jgi:predicted metalloprotease
MLAMATISFGLAGTSLAQTGTDDRVDAVTGFAIETSRQRESGELFDLYDGMHPDARNALSRQALMNWADSGEMGTPLDDPVIANVTFADWTWEVTGDVYEDAAIVTYTQQVERSGAEVEDAGEWVFAHDGQRWRWFPNLTGDEIATLAAEEAGSASDYTPTFRRAAYVRIDRFWENVFSEAGLEYQPVDEIVAVVDEPFDTGCGQQESIEDFAIFYCTGDATVYYDPEFQELIVSGAGSYGFTTIIAHEWGHHIQNVLGIDMSGNVQGSRGLHPIEIELQADCLAGIYAQDALAHGDIDQDDVDAALRVTLLAGDPAGTDWDDVDAHGSAAERVQSFYAGFEDGFVGCNIDLGDYAA